MILTDFLLFYFWQSESDTEEPDVWKEEEQGEVYYKFMDTACDMMMLVLIFVLFIYVMINVYKKKQSSIFFILLILVFYF